MVGLRITWIKIKAAIAGQVSPFLHIDLINTRVVSRKFSVSYLEYVPNDTSWLWKERIQKGKGQEVSALMEHKLVFSIIYK